jgi:hypothetical protein
MKTEFSLSGLTLRPFTSDEPRPLAVSHGQTRRQASYLHSPRKPFANDQTIRLDKGKAVRRPQVDGKISFITEKSNKSKLAIENLNDVMLGIGDKVAAFPVRYDPFGP